MCLDGHYGRYSEQEKLRLMCSFFLVTEVDRAVGLPLLCSNVLVVVIVVISRCSDASLWLLKRNKE